jgi:hypothetical protein
MVPTELIYVKTINDRPRLEPLLIVTSRRILRSIEHLCRDICRPFILRLIGSEKVATPFMSREEFLY